MPHQQIKSSPIASPPDVERFFAVLAAGKPDAPNLEDRPINVCAVAGGFLEQGGEIGVAVGTIDMSEEEEEQILAIALDRLHKAGYDDAHAVGEEDGLFHDFIPDSPGSLYLFIKGIATQNLQNGRTIADIAIGAYNEADKTTLVQVYCPEVKTQASREQWQAELPDILGLEIPTGD